jgi:hypothetical protein
MSNQSAITTMKSIIFGIQHSDSNCIGNNFEIRATCIDQELFALTRATIESVNEHIYRQC